MTQWISIDFAVPPDDREVLARALYKWTLTNGEKRSSSDIHIASRKVFKNGRIKWRGNGGYISTDESATKVTHWMPLPEPPKEKS